MATPVPAEHHRLLYGAGFGIGIGTFIPFATLYVVMAWAVLNGSLAGGTVALAAFGMGRALPLVGIGASAASDVEALLRRVDGLRPLKTVVALANGALLALMGGFFATLAM